MKPLAICIALTLTVLASSACSGPTRAVSHPTPQEHALERLRISGVSDELLAFLDATPITEDRDRIVQLNVLGFLGRADYSGHYSRTAVRKSVAFMRKHRLTLAQAERRYGVPAELITSLLWVETKLGTRLGSHNVPRVYFSLLQADHPEVLRATLSALSARRLAILSGTTPAEAGELERKAIERSSSKASWALQELRAIDEIRRRNSLNPSNLSGSYAGAFGIPQFIPSSYLQWARARAGDSPPDLFSSADAIHSVAHYLHSNGWKKREPANQRTALFHYNRAEGYVTVIQKLAASIRKNRPDR